MSTRDELVMSDGVVMGIDTSESRAHTSESRADTSESRADTSESRADTLCSHEGTAVALTKGGTGRAEGFQRVACGQTFAEDPNEAAIKKYEETTKGGDAVPKEGTDAVPKEGTDDEPASSLAVAMGKRLNQAFAAREDGYNFEETIEKADKDVRALLDQAARNIDRIAGKRDRLKEAIDKAEKSLAERYFLDQAARNINHIAGKRDCLKEADKIINGERQDSYGAPEDSFTIIAGYWNVFLAAKLRTLGVDVKDLLSPLDTTNMMVLFKQARKLGQQPSRDNYVDSCGYEAIGADRLSE